jgi:hypothetical protein
MTGKIAREDLVAGKLQAFVSVHTAAMLSLVSNPAVITVPETLAFDVNRLTSIQREYSRIVDGATVLVIANHAVIGRAKQPSHEQRMVMTELAKLIVDGSDAIVDEFCLKLDAASVLTDPLARGKLVSALTSGISNKNDGVRQLM